MPPLQFDWSQGRAFIQDGTIFYSPNCSRSVLIPPERAASSPFNKERLDAFMFRQPVWWSDEHGWQGFIPLAPLYTSSPFQPFCWMSRIVAVEVSLDPAEEIFETRYKMHPEDCLTWREHERLLIVAAEQIRVWYKIPGNLPPSPSTFNCDREHKSQAMAKRMISLARDWFAVWMGFMSYMLSSTERYSPSSSSAYSRPDPNSPLPVWYSRLQEKHGYSAAWLDGLSSSTVCSFDMQTPRAGMVFRWSIQDKHRPSIEHFFSLQIPVWFVWSSAEEQAIQQDRSYAYLKPPEYLIQDALTLLFASPAVKIPLAGLILQRYYSLGSDPVTNETVKQLKHKYAPSFVLQYTTQIFLGQDKHMASSDSITDTALNNVPERRQTEHSAASHATSTVPTQTMLEEGQLFSHWQEFLSKRQKRREEIIKVETQIERQERFKREQNPAVKNADLYTWEKIRSSGGIELYMRLRVDKKKNKDVFASYKNHHKIYNSIANEWDLCKEFHVPSGYYHDAASGSYDSDNESFGEDYTDGTHHGPSMLPRQSHHGPVTPPRLSFDQRQSSTSRQIPIQRSTPDDMDTEEEEEEEEEEGVAVHVNYSQDVVQTLSYGYGYVPSMPGDEPVSKVSEEEWDRLLLTLGFVRPFAALDVEDHERQAIFDFVTGVLKKNVLSSHSDDLDETSHAALSHLFDFKAIHHPAAELFVFSGPRSTASDWLLGVHTPEVALYVCRYIISNPTAHTLTTVATRLLDRGIPFRTLLGLECGLRNKTITKPYTPASYRFSNHKFTLQDFEASMLQCQSILSKPQGRAALLRGGIIWRIAKEFLSADGILSGPSVEVTLHRAGYLHVSATPGIQYCDDELTEDEIALICGTYTLYTGAIKGQIAVKSWFPPPICWQKDRTGVQWVEWTARNEQFFIDWLKDIHAGKAQPMSVVEWTSRLRGQRTSRTLRDNNRVRAAEFTSKLIPIKV